MIPQARQSSDQGRASWSLPLAANLVCIMLVLSPLPLGGTGTAANFTLEAATAAVVLLAIGCGAVPSWSIAVILAGGTLAALQVLPLPPGLLAAVAPGPFEAWRGEQAYESLPWLTVTVNPGLTGTAGRRILLYVSATAVIAALARQVRLRARIFQGLAATGALVWSLGLAIPAQREAGRILLGFIDLGGPIDWWLTPIKQPWATGAFGNRARILAGKQTFEMIDWGVGDGFGPYIISNHFAAAIYLAVPAIACWVLLQTAGGAPAAVRWIAAVAALAAAVGTVGWLADSRAGAAATLLAAMTFCSLATTTARLRWCLGTLTAAYALLLAALTLLFHGYLGILHHAIPDSLAAKVTALQGDGRVVASNLAGSLFLRSPWAGWGLGTYGDLYRAEGDGTLVQHYAHNEYIQLLAEGGLLGGGLAVMLLAWIVYRFGKYLNQAEGSRRQWGAAAWAGLAGLAFHSAFDWNLHVPANVWLTSVVAGLAIASSYPDNVQPSSMRASGTDVPKILRIILGGAVIGGMMFLGRDAVSDGAETRLLRAITVCRRETPKESEAAVDDVLKNAALEAERVAFWDPTNAQLAALLGDVHLLLAVRRGREGASAHLAAATEWFEQARANAAQPPGLPEPEYIGPL